MEYPYKEIAAIVLLVVALGYVIWKIYRTDALSKQRLAAIEAAGDGIGIVDASHNLTYINKAMIELHGIHDVSKYIGHYWGNLYTEKGREYIKTVVMPTLEKEGYWRGETPIVTESGKVIPTELFLAALPRGGFIGTARDMSVQKRAQEEKAILHNKFVQAQKMEIVGALTGGIAHDFNNMLTVISGNLDMLDNEVKSPDSVVHLRAAVRAVKRGAELTQRLLAFSRQQILAPQILNVNTIIPHTVEMMKRTLGEHVEILFEPHKNLWSANIDSGQIENALLNLCINARDAMPQGGTIKISTQNIDIHNLDLEKYHYITPANYVRITVADTGQGIPADYLERVFEPFFTTKEVGQGSGLGLSMVYGFTKQSGGYVTVDSVVGSGTSISLYFPKAGTSGADKVDTAPAYDKTKDRQTILLVDDEPSTLEYSKKLLLDLGYNVHTAQNGAEAVMALEKLDRLDLLLSNMVMQGGVNGKELAEEAKMSFPHVRILFVTGNMPESIHDDVVHDRETGFLAKPYDKAALSDKVGIMLNSNDKAT